MIIYLHFHLFGTYESVSALVGWLQSLVWLCFHHDSFLPFLLLFFFFFHLFAHFNFNYELCSESLFRITIFHLTGTGGTNSASRWTSRSSRTVTIEIINILRRLQANAIDWNRRFICLIFHTNWWNNNNDNDTREYLIWLLKSWHDSLIPLVSRKCIHTNAHTLSNISAVVIIILCSIFIFV